MKKLILFDIDGTLLSVHGAGARALLAAVEAWVGQPIASEGYVMSGKTDTQILLELSHLAGVSREQAWANRETIYAAYLRGLTEHLALIEPKIFQGVEPLLARLLATERAVVGLLTGNLEQAAYQKLDRAGLAHFFSLGAFGDHAPERKFLPQRAIERAMQLTGQYFMGKDVVIIGDTPNDLYCGQHFGVRAVGVATGRYSTTELATHPADLVYPDLSDTNRVLAEILG